MERRPEYPNVLSYIYSINRFTDNLDIIVHDIGCLFDTWQLDEWKKKEQSGPLLAKNGTYFYIYYLTPEEEDEAFDFFGFQESFGLKTDRQQY